MVTVDSFISIDPIGRTRYVYYTCDRCGCACNQSGTRKERLYQYDNDQLCWECLWDAMKDDQVFTEAE